MRDNKMQLVGFSQADERRLERSPTLPAGKDAQAEGAVGLSKSLFLGVIVLLLLGVALPKTAAQTCAELVFLPGMCIARQ